MSSNPGDESLVQYAQRRLTAKHLKALEQIFTGRSKHSSLEKLLTDNPSQSKKSFAHGLVSSHGDELERFLHILETEFSRGEIATNDVVEFLGDHYGSQYPTLSKDLLEDVSSRPALLIATYYCMYQPQNGALAPDFQDLLAFAKIYKHNTKTTYFVDGEQVPFGDLETNIQDFLSGWNGEGERKAAVERTIDVAEETARLKVYREKLRGGRYIFEFRQLGLSKPRNLEDPTIEYESEFSVDTLGISVRNLADSVKVELSGKLSGWIKFLDRFVEEVFEFDNGGDALVEKAYPGANHVLGSARKSAENAAVDDEKQLIGEINDATETLWKDVIVQLQNDPDVSQEEVDEAEEWYPSIALSGFHVLKDSQTNVNQAGVRSQGILEDVETQVSRIGLVEYFQQASNEKICLFFQIQNPDTGERAEFKVHKGEWSTVGRGIESAAFQRVEALMENEL